MSNVALHHVHALHDNDCARRQYRAPATVLSERSHSFLSKSCRPFSATISRPMREHHSSAVSSCVRCSATSSSTSSVTLYPAGKKQARVKIPACFLKVSVQDALSATSAQVLDEAIGAGITGVWLVDEGNEGGGGLYDAAIAVKEILRGRSILLVEDRTDIATAAEADGVILSTTGVPVAVAKRMLGETSLVARVVNNAGDARSAAADGASLIVLQEEGEGGSPSVQSVEAAREGQSSGSSIPLLLFLKTGEAASCALEAARRADGVALPLPALPATAASCAGSPLSSPAEQVAALGPLLGSGAGEPTGFLGQPSRETGGGGRHLLDAKREELLERERALLSEILALLRDVTPSMPEIELLVDALKGLDELFLVVVVGEFNSGKSTVINALLGNRFLPDGILPTTNEISIIKYSASGSEEVQQDGDGQYVRYLPAPLLKEVNIVDTPGTNVILQRQQRLTEEYVPRADLVLFTMSADRPFTESEVQFLRYIRKWGKKVVFIVNKVDILAGDQEVQEVQRFVADNARAVLGVDSARVIPIAARSALAAKIDLLASRGQYADLTSGGEALASDGRWRDSQFGKLESFMVDFLAGGAGGSESMRLKLQTPLFVASALLEAAQKQLDLDLSLAQQEAAAVGMVTQQLKDFRRSMEADSAAQRSEGRAIVGAAVKRAQALVDQTLQVSNLEALRTYLLGGKADARGLLVARDFERDVVGDTAGRLKGLVAQHSKWLRSNCQRQLQNYRAFAEARAEQLGRSLSALPASAAEEASQSSEALAAARREWRASHNLSSTPSPPPEAGAAGGEQAAEGASAQQGGGPATLPKEETAVALVAQFEPRAAALVLEEEVREAVIGTAGAAVGAGVLGVGLTVFLPSTLEDVLAVALAGLLGYVALLNLPLRRAEAKAKLEKVASNFITEVEEKLQNELATELDATEEQVKGWMEPLAALTAGQVRRAEQGEARRAALASSLTDLQEAALRIA